MFDIGFWELAIIAIIALLILGPDRLPEFARTTGLWIRKTRLFLSGIKNDIDRELRAEDLKRMIKPRELDEIHEIIEETRTTITDTTNHLSLTDTADTSTNPTKSSIDKSDGEPNPGNTKNSHSSHTSGDMLDNMIDGTPDNGLDTSMTDNGKKSTSHSS
uniref:Sec-independent protein translocase protein TatB n=1 Tax=Candidatus Kentrum sp. TUN TaxID=2126343 RepID=A0A450ZSX7_9GAMM|nr:MAG: sec-independent protein translocase protein TatB [Candidatus Kentron sp. TUN]VFK53380.1 MAG: sec-independent protein translocase protein TatB [Candidatus Kentron sp. TUN]VFK56880.1 MAG: sec-independent protein translocase protein TatB [Candidatus Kentron sp. TUN]